VTRPLLLALAAVGGGFAWVMIASTLGGVLLIIAGVGALGMMVLPAAMDTVVALLSGGFRRRWR
jgi:hypothetical protein